MDIKYISGACCVSVCLLLGSQSIHASPVVEMLGDYSNQRTYLVSDDPHMEGYSLTLYRQGKIVFGRFCRAAGIEVPCAPIQKAIIENRKTLNFQVKMVTGTVLERPAYQLIEFKGEIRNKYISGVISTKSSYAQLEPAEIERVKLRLVPYKGEPISSYQEWASDRLNKSVD